MYPENGKTQVAENKGSEFMTVAVVIAVLAFLMTLNSCGRDGIR